jgi:hypothetical protein
MRTSLAAAGSLIGLAVALVAPAGASAATTRDSFDVTGTVFECPTHTYTVTSGAINEVMHESVDANRHHALHCHPTRLIESGSWMRTGTSTR